MEKCSTTTAWSFPLDMEAQDPLLQPPLNHLHAGHEDFLPPYCSGCHLRIVDKFYLSAVDSKWHVSCLKCSECGIELESHVSCYERDGLILCKDDYLR